MNNVKDLLQSAEMMEFRAWFSRSSSNIEQVQYVKKYNSLEVEFKSGSRYKYSNVPEDVYESMITAKSMGSYFYWNIRSKYKFIQV